MRRDARIIRLSNSSPLVLHFPPFGTGLPQVVRMLRRECFLNRVELLWCVLALASLFVLSACWGGGSSSTPASQNNPTPSITSLSPSGATAGEAASTVTISGTGFVQGSTAEWNQSNRVTTFVSATQLKMTLPSTDLSTAGTADIAVINPAPGGGASAAAKFMVSNPAPQVSSLTPGTVTVNDGGSVLKLEVDSFPPPPQPGTDPPAARPL
jgi:hypothetical protein